MNDWIGLANSHLLLESRTEGLEIRLEKPDVPAHHAEMGNLLSLNPKIHCLRAHPEIMGGLPHIERALFGLEFRSRSWGSAGRYD